MKRIIFAVSLVVFCAAWAFAQESALVLDDFECVISGGPEGTVDFGAGNGATVEVAAGTDQVHGGKQSLKVTFDAVDGGYIFVAKGFSLDAKKADWLAKPEAIDWKKYKAISFWMLGTASKTKIAVDIKDNGGEMWRYEVVDDTNGWKQVVCPFASFAARGDWQPNNADKNGTLDFPLRSYQFEPLPAAKGTLYFDDVELN